MCLSEHRHSLSLFLLPVLLLSIIFNLPFLLNFVTRGYFCEPRGGCVLMFIFLYILVVIIKEMETFLTTI